MGGGGAKKAKKSSDREARLAEAYRAFKEKQAAQEFDNEGESIGSVVPRKKSKKEKRKVQDVQRDDSGDEGDGETGAHSKAKEAEDAPAKRPKSTPGSGPISAASGCKFDVIPLAKGGLRPETLAAVAELGFTNTTPVQQATIPLLLSNKDVAVQACTGSGKTVAFLIPAFEMVLRCDDPWGKHDVGALVIAPTRELAIQIMSVAQAFSKHAPSVKLMSMTGGADAEDSNQKFIAEGANVVVGTPGRLAHVISNLDKFNVKRLELLVLDEADRLLDMGFQATLNDILGKLPKLRRTGLFSATMNNEVAALARAGLRNPRQICVTQHGTHKKEQSTPTSLSNLYMLCETRQKMNQLVDFLSRHREDKVMVYLLTCFHVDLCAKILPLLPALSGIEITSMHGKMVQKRRSKTYESFIEKEAGVLICTDVAARGLDIPDVDWIVQYDAPQDPSFFIHRVGRTARMGRKGNSLVLLAPNEDTYVEFLTIRKVPLAKIEPALGVADVLDEVRAVIRQDLDLHERSQKAFVSFVRAYKEHQCNFIFQLDKLDLGGVALAMGLLKLPRMPELKGVAVRGFAPAHVDVHSLQYKDKVREKARKVRVKEAERKAAEEEAKGPVKVTRKEWLQKQKNVAWSQSNRLVKKTEKRIRNENYVSRSQAAMSPKGSDFSDDDESDMEDDARLIRKLRQGRISKSEYDHQAGFDSGGDDSD